MQLCVNERLPEDIFSDWWIGWLHSDWSDSRRWKCVNGLIGRLWWVSDQSFRWATVNRGATHLTDGPIELHCSAVKDKFPSKKYPK